MFKFFFMVLELWHLGTIGPSTYNFSYLQGESPSSFQRHGDDGDKSVCDSEVEHEEVDIGPAPGNIIFVKLLT